MRTRHVPIALILLAASVSPAATSAKKPAPPKPKTEYAVIRMDGKKVGHAKMTRTVAKGQVANSTVMKITITRGSVSISLNLTETTTETAAGEPVSFRVVQDMGMMAQTISGTIQADGTMKVSMAAGGGLRR